MPDSIARTAHSKQLSERDDAMLLACTVGDARKGCHHTL